MVGWHWPVPEKALKDHLCKAKVLSPMDSVRDLPAALVDAGPSLTTACTHET